VDAWVERRRADAWAFVDVSSAELENVLKRHASLAHATVQAAERVLRHEFDLLGSGPYTPIDPERGGEDGYRPIDWYVDPVAGLRFPRGIPIGSWDLYAMRPGRADVKFPWELARCQHWPVLGQAYRLTGDERFAIEIARELRDFMEANPIGTAVNWSCTMDVALRAANWTLGLELVRRCPALPPAFWRDAYEALFDHGVFIEGHLENTYEVTSNHFLSNVVGLFYLVPVFRDLPKGAVWNQACRRWLAQEIDGQVLEDGADFESSVPYHRLVTELFLGAARVAEWSGQPLPPPILSRLRTMVDFLAAVLRPDGLMPQVGDADDGRLHVLSAYGTWRPQDPRHLFGPATCVFAEPAWLSLVDDWGEWEAAWWGLAPVSGAAPRVSCDGVRHFPNAGLTMVRRGRDYLLVTNGIVGTGGFGNHKHNDLLGFEYHVGAEPVLVDPGSYVYTSDPEARNRFRGTRSHNTVMVDGQEQNELRPDWLFRMFESARPEQVAVFDEPDRLGFTGRHIGYTRLPEPVTHERRFTISRDTGVLTIVDVLSGRGRHRIRWHFHFAPGAEVTVREPGRLQIGIHGASLTFTTPMHLESRLGSAWYSPSYGVRVPCQAADFESDEQLDEPREYVFRIAR
jgi:hypothetical protein